MNIEELIEKKFKNKIVAVKAGEFLFIQQDALSVIDECEQWKSVILGLDFWKLCADGDIMEVNSTAWENLYKGSDASQKTVEAARELIGDSLPDNADYISFVLKGQEVGEINL